MAEKPKLKETEEILNSIGKRRGKQPPLVEGDIIQPPIQRVDPPAPKKSRRRTDRRAPEEETAEPVVDRNPLDFNKYQLPKRKKKAPEPEFALDDVAAPARVEIVGNPATADPAPEPPPVVVQAEPPVPPEASLAYPGPHSVSIASAKPTHLADAMRPEPIPEIKEFEFEDLEAEQQTARESRRLGVEAETRRLAALEQERLKAEEERQRLEAKQAERLAEMELEARRKLLEDKDYREDVMERLSTQFEDEFSQMFEGRQEDEDKSRPQWLTERRKAQIKPPKPTPKPEPRRSPAPPQKARTDGRSYGGPVAEKPPADVVIDPVAAVEAEQEAESFLARFQQDVLREEEHREIDFKETLAEKFMRERERYLRELGIAEQMEAEEQAEAPPHNIEPVRRKLDFQIQPEMHMQQGETPNLRPVTYSRNATVQPQVPVEPLEIPVPPLPDKPENLGTGGEGKKTSAQLLLELGAQNTQRAQRKTAPAKGPTQFNFRFTPAAGEGDQKAKKPKKPSVFSRVSVTGRIVALSAACGLLILALVLWTVTSALNPGGLVQPPADDPAAAGDTQEQLMAYENYIATTQTKFSDVTVMRSGLTLSNLTVANRLVVEEEAAAAGSLSLSNVIVGDMIYIQASGTDVLDLRDVQTPRMVINNTKSAVTIRTSGSTSIDMIELRTPVTLEQGEMVDGTQGVRAVLVKNDGNTAALAFDLKNASLQTLTTQGESVLSFDAGQVENMSADGSFNLSGTGRVQTLSAGYTIGAGAGDFVTPKPVNILIQGVEVGHLNIKSPANLNLATQVDSAAAADSINLGGSGSIGSLILNQEASKGRLAVDISGLNIQQLTTNAETLLYSSGSSAINTLTANQSTYALGNKVNHLKANANGIIYEKEPDMKTIAPGISPPQSKADNPNINYSLGSVGEASAPATDTTADPVATTCDHARELGGFVLGDGSIDNPFVVSTPAQLAHVEQHLSSHFLQTGDLDLADDSSFSGGFPVIGAAGTRFSGSYNGGGYGISNLRVIADGDSVGLFGENTGTIRNVHILSGEISAGVDAFAGSVAGFNLGTVEACSNGANINGPTSSYGGGIVGYNYGGTVRDCYNTAKVVGGDIVGGIVGMNRNGTTEARVAGSYNVGVLEGENILGGVVGTNEDAVVTNCYYLEATADDGIGSGAGTAAMKTSGEMSSSQMAADLAAGNDSSLWQAGSGGSYAYPTLKAPTVAAPTLPESMPGAAPAASESEQPISLK